MSQQDIFQNYPINNQNLGERWKITDLQDQNGVPYPAAALGSKGSVQGNIPSTPVTGILEIDTNSVPDINHSQSNFVYNPVTVTFTNGNVTIEWNNYIRTIENVYSEPSLATGSPITLIPKNFIIPILDID